jgi:GcrA cell cycle regulator
MTRVEQAAALAPIKAKIAELWALGETMGQIALATGVTKNAVVGHVHRMGLPGRPSPILFDHPIQPRGDRRVPLKVLPKLADLVPVAPPLAPVATPAPPRAAERRPTPARDPRICCWPIGEPGIKEFRFCEAGARAGSPYCVEHHRVAYVRVREIAV